MKINELYEKLEPNFKFWFSVGDEKVIGSGPIQLLKKIEELGSLNRAAESIEMSYSKAFKLIKTMEQNLSVTLLKKTIGGAHGGGSELTEEARKLVSDYDAFRKEAEAMLQETFEKYFHKKE